MIQPESHEAESVSIVLMTHAAGEQDVAAAIKEIEQLEVVSQPTCLIRVEHDLD
jgi:homoserine dehydrogenase